MINRRTVTIDCETLPLEMPIPANGDFADSSLSNLSPTQLTPLTIAASAPHTKRDDTRAALNGDTGRLLCLGFIDEASGRPTLKGVLGWNRALQCFDGDEAALLYDFWERMRGFRTGIDRIVGHNIYNFDLRFIYKRSVVCGVRPTIELSFARYRNQPIYDTMCEWEKWNLRDSISLDRLARVLGLESPKTDECNGSRIAELYAQGQHQLIRDYCMKDVETTRHIYRRMTFVDSPNLKPFVTPEQLTRVCHAAVRGV